VIYGVLPVKNPWQAKTRLANVLSPQERETLARAMFSHALRQLTAARGLDRVVVAAQDAAILSEAQRAGAEILAEASQGGHSQSADAAVRQCLARGATSVLLAPIDAPLLRAADIEDLLARSRAAPAPSLIIVPSWDRTGTNAMVCTPPDLLATAFGPHSFPVHVERARRNGGLVHIAEIETLMLDVDTPEDLLRCVSKNPNGRTGDLLRRFAETIRSRR
jgi:2-phospho-L-lactate guanylyltransferase